MNPLSQQVSAALTLQRPELAADVVAREFARHPELDRRYGPAGRVKCLQDAGYHIAYLAQSIAAESAELFVDYLGWAKVMLAKRGVPAGDLAALLEILKESVTQQLRPEQASLAIEFLDAGLRRLPSLPDDLVSCIAEGTPLAALATQYVGALLRGERHTACKLILDTVERGTPVRDVYLHVFQRSQYEIGRLWQVNQISVGQEHYCTAATQLIMSQLYPYIFGGVKTHGTLVGTCVSGDLHEIGARMVSDFFEMDGWSTHYLGANVPASSVVQTVVERKADLLAISATIPYHVGAVQSLIAAVRQTPECAGLKILVGGYPFKTAPGLWRTIGADGSAPDAQEALSVGQRLVTRSFSV